MMSLLDTFLLTGNDSVDATFGTETMVVAGQTFHVVKNEDRKSYAGAMAGLESNVQAQVMAQPADVSDPRSLLQKKCTVGGIAYRIAEVATGTVAITFTLVDASESR
jgi:acetoacetate decarboxylase